MTIITGAPRSPRELYDALPEKTPMRAEIIDGSLVVSPMGTPEHGWIGYLLAEAFAPIARSRGWRLWPGNVDICIAGPRDPLTPDFTMAPRDCPRWGDRELLSTGLVMVAEVVSAGSVTSDREKKPGIYASGGVPLMLLIDPERESAEATVYSDPAEGGYHTRTTVRLGEKLRIPAPVDHVFDTSVLLED